MNEEQKGLFTPEQIEELLALMDGIETGVNLPARYNKYYVAWETLYRHLLNLLGNPTPTIDEDSEIEEEEPEEEEIQPPDLPDGYREPTKEEISKYLADMAAQAKQKDDKARMEKVRAFRKPTDSPPRVVEPPKMPEAKVSAVVRPSLIPQGQKNAGRSMPAPTPLDDDVDLLED